jgi:hypothetical protein
MFSGWRHIVEKEGGEQWGVRTPHNARKAFKDSMSQLQNEFYEKVREHVNGNPALEANKEHINYWDNLESYCPVDHNQCQWQY